MCSHCTLPLSLSVSPQIPAELITLDPDQVSRVDSVQPKEEGEEVSALAI